MQLSYDQGKTGLNSEAVAQYNGNISIDYNYLNLPQQITFDSGDEIHYLYTAEGQKLQKRIVEQAGSTNKTDYFGGRIYESGQLKEIAHEEGRILATTTGFEYHYYLRDHLGNVRVEFKEDADGEATITQENHYYPFGMRFSGEVFANNDNDFRYNGKEMQDDFGLDWYDYGARFYDPAIARWHVVDPLADKAPGWTPYRYGFNNPMSFIDPDGRAERDGLDGWFSSVSITGGKGMNGSISYGSNSSSNKVTYSLINSITGAEVGTFELSLEGGTATGSDEGKNDEDDASPVGVDFTKFPDSKIIIHIANSIRDANQNGQEYIDMRQIFLNFPKYGAGVDIAGNFIIGKNKLSVHMTIAIYDNMKISIYPARMEQVGPFSNVHVGGVVKNGYWDMMEFNRSGGNIPMLMIQTDSNFDIFYNYIYKLNLGL